MRQLGIKKDDEVIILGATCSVMVNAILRIKAKPIYTDIDLDTFGSCAKKIKNKITTKTKLIVAQHSFGIPCKIDKIVKLAMENNIFLLEDCALTFDSSFKGMNVGNFGDAALFSSDHSKPINTMIGGIIYSKNFFLIKALRALEENLHELPIVKKKSLWSRFLFEKYFYNPKWFGMKNIFELLFTLFLKISKYPTPFLDNEFCSKIMISKYKYPSKLPSFIAAIGLIELDRWKLTAIERKKNLSFFLKIIKKNKLFNYIPKSYLDKKFDVVPLRIALVHPKGSKIREQLNRIIDVSQIWFSKPIEATDEPVENFGYIHGTCPISENTGKNIINIPCNLPKRKLEEVIKIIAINIKSN